MPGCRDGGVGIRRAQPHPEKPIRASVPQIVFSHKNRSHPVARDIRSLRALRMSLRLAADMFVGFVGLRTAVNE
jgi:hypothetical protein